MEQRMEEENVVALTEEGVKALENIHVCNDNTLQMMVLLVKAPSEEENINLPGSFTLLGTKEKKNQVKKNASRLSFGRTRATNWAPHTRRLAA